LKSQFNNLTFFQMRSTVNKKEIENFNKIASEWWNPKGDFEPLHSLNPLRLYYIKERIEEHFSLTSKKTIRA